MSNIVWLASHNKRKFDELKALFNYNTNLDLRMPDELGIKLDVPEPYDEYELNAAAKMEAYEKAIQEKLGEKPMVIADDSGLEVDRIEPLPGVVTARFMPDEMARMISDGTIPKEQVARLRQDLLLWFLKMHSMSTLFNTNNLDKIEYRATYVCNLVCNFTTVKDPYDVYVGRCNGWLVKSVNEAKGDNGFTFDPLFRFSKDDDRTLAELTTYEKCRVSHRGKAFNNLLKDLERTKPNFVVEKWQNLLQLIKR